MPNKKLFEANQKVVFIKYDPEFSEVYGESEKTHFKIGEVIEVEFDFFVDDEGCIDLNNKEFGVWPYQVTTLEEYEKIKQQKKFNRKMKKILE